MDYIELGQALFGDKNRTVTSPTESNTVAYTPSSPSNAHIIVGTATSVSDDGMVTVNVGGKVIPADDLISGGTTSNISISSNVDVQEGDSVYISVVGSDNTGKTMTVIGVPGGGDRTKQEVADVKLTADEAYTEAKGKATNYTEKPEPPYAVGDTWTDIYSGKVYVCTTAKSSGEEFSQSDWVVSAKAGADATLVCVISSQGEAFKNNEVNTTLDVTIFHGSSCVTTKEGLTKEYGASYFLRWWFRQRGSDQYSELLSTDSRLSENGFKLTVTSDDVDQQIVFRCELDDGR